MKSVILILFLIALAMGNPVSKSNNEVQSIESKMIRRMDELAKTHSIRVYGDIITLEKLDDETTERASRSADPFLARVEEFLNTRKIQIRLPSDGSTADIFGRALGEKSIDIELRSLTQGASEARTKIKRMILPVLLALKLKALIILPIIITFIGLVGLKGLGVGLAALLLSGSVALKALLTPPPPAYPARVSYGIVKPEIHHDHWHRSQEEMNQPYRAWAPEYNVDPYPYQDLP